MYKYVKDRFFYSTREGDKLEGEPLTETIDALKKVKSNRVNYFGEVVSEAYGKAFEELTTGAERANKTLANLTQKATNAETYDDKKRDFYNNILRCVEKFGFDRLMKLATQKRNRVISRYSDKPIEFKSLSFSGRCRKTKIIGYNLKFGSVINAYISLSGLGRKSFDIPIIYNKD